MGLASAVDSAAPLFFLALPFADVITDVAVAVYASQHLSSCNDWDCGARTLVFTLGFLLFITSLYVPLVSSSIFCYPMREEPLQWLRYMVLLPLTFGLLHLVLRTLRVLLLLLLAPALLLIDSVVGCGFMCGQPKAERASAVKEVSGSAARAPSGRALAANRAHAHAHALEANISKRRGEEDGEEVDTGRVCCPIHTYALYPLLFTKKEWEFFKKRSAVVRPWYCLSFWLTGRGYALMAGKLERGDESLLYRLALLETVVENAGGLLMAAANFASPLSKVSMFFNVVSSLFEIGYLWGRGRRVSSSPGVVGSPDTFVWGVCFLTALGFAGLMYGAFVGNAVGFFKGVLGDMKLSF